MRNWIKELQGQVTDFWNWLFPKPSVWLLDLCRELRESAIRFSAKNLGDGFYHLEMGGSLFKEEILFSFEMGYIEVRSLRETVELNRAEISLLYDAIEAWAASKRGQAFFEGER